MEKNDEPTEKLVKIYSGEPTEIQVLKGVLEEEGFFANIPNEIIKTVDPFVTGPGMFVYDLQVPSFQAEKAIQFIQSLHKDMQENTKEKETLSEEEKLKAEMESFGKRLRWSLVFLLFSMGSSFLTLIFITVYFFFLTIFIFRVKTKQIYPYAFKLTLFSSFLCFLWVILFFALYNSPYLFGL